MEEEHGRVYRLRTAKLREVRLDSEETQSLSSSLILIVLHQNIGCRRGPLTWKQQRASQALVGTSKTDGEDPRILSLLSLGMACPTLALSQISSSMCASSFEWARDTQILNADIL